MLSKLAIVLLCLSVTVNFALWKAYNTEADRCELLQSEVAQLESINKATNDVLTAKEQFRQEIAKSLKEKREKLSHVDEFVEDDSLYIGNLLDVLGVYKDNRADETGFAPEPATGGEPYPAAAGGNDAQQ